MIVNKNIEASVVGQLIVVAEPDLHGSHSYDNNWYDGAMGICRTEFSITIRLMGCVNQRDLVAVEAGFNNHNNNW